MDVNMNSEESQMGIREAQQALLENAPVSLKRPKTAAQKALRKTFKGTAQMSKLLPTGTVLTFQILSPILTHQGQCHTMTSQAVTLGFLMLCSFSCFILCFTDSFRDERGKVRYGVASINGLWVVDGSVKLPPEEAAKYRLSFVDFFHAFTSILLFGAVALFDKNVVSCFDPKPSQEVEELLVAFPVGMGILCSLLFVAFPSQRHGIGFPLSRN